MSTWLEFHGQLQALYAKYPAESQRYESDYDALAARLAEAERLLRGAIALDSGDNARRKWLAQYEAYFADSTLNA